MNGGKGALDYGEGIVAETTGIDFRQPQITLPANGGQNYRA